MSKREDLIDLYGQMAREGYKEINGSERKVVYSDMEIRKFKDPVRKLIKAFECKTLLDYGCGGSDYDTIPFDNTGINGRDYFDLEKIYYYEPARNIDQRTKADVVVCFDVLEHIWINDIVFTLRDIFQYANKLVIINVACYSASALLPNGDNAHITVRDPNWWSGVVNAVCMENFPDLAVQLYCSPTYKTATDMGCYSMAEFEKMETFVANIQNLPSK